MSIASDFFILIRKRNLDEEVLKEDVVVVDTGISYMLFRPPELRNAFG